VETRAVIDVGTNSVKLLVATVSGDQVHPILEESKQTRLGQGFYETHLLQAEAIEKTAEAVSDFVKAAREWNPSSIRIFATSAARDALNKEALLSALQVASGVEVKIITGEQEADWAFRGVCTGGGLSGQNILVMDVGGGSTEFILGQGNHIAFAKSFKMGTVRLLEKLAISDPPLASDLHHCEEIVQRILLNEVRPLLLPVIESSVSVGSTFPQLVGTGGTTSILSRIQLNLRRYDRELMEKSRITKAQIESEKNRLWELPLEQRKCIIGLPPNRADVILTGVVIFDQVMKVLGLDSLCVSTRGLRFAALMD
jgi:exopolyphosphatase/guanosine-5'-triphosphate,3'-diphosphate pyrophosphatase